MNRLQRYAWIPSALGVLTWTTSDEKLALRCFLWGTEEHEDRLNRRPQRSQRIGASASNGLPAVPNVGMVA
jgi:hypothetical protein